ncbi:hypothetical protein [Bacillus atrophaeus]|nr:hypothetical protein [Bacillus atrophaeus]
MVFEAKSLFSEAKNRKKDYKELKNQLINPRRACKAVDEGEE